MPTGHQEQECVCAAAAGMRTSSCTDSSNPMHLVGMNSVQLEIPPRFNAPGSRDAARPILRT
jgi:hypothetical protein